MECTMMQKIDFHKLPNKFIFKTTNGNHTNIICKNKMRLDINQTIKKLNDQLSKRTVKAGREWVYYDIKPLIVCEKFLEEDKNNDLTDYKFYGFNGRVNYLKVSKIEQIKKVK